MKVVGLDGKDYKLRLLTKQRESCSKPHLRARNLLKTYFPNHIVYEEVTLLGTKKFNKGVLFADFLIPSQDLLVEVHGEQHYQQSFLHGSKQGFIDSQVRDRRKIEWCNLNDIIYIELPSTESDNEWKYRLDNRI